MSGPTFLQLLQGLGLSFLLWACALLVALAGGLLVALGRLSPRPWLRWPATAWVEAIRNVDQPLFQPIGDLVSTSIAFGRVAILGDAAFVARPHAAKGAIKAGQRLSEPEMQHLFDALFATELPYHDVHGRPTIVRLSTGELERKFGR